MARDYTKIKAWQLADQLALLVYKATKKFPKSEVWGVDISDEKIRRVRCSKYRRGVSQEE